MTSGSINEKVHRILGEWRGGAPKELPDYRQTIELARQIAPDLLSRLKESLIDTQTRIGSGEEELTKKSVITAIEKAVKTLEKDDPAPDKITIDEITIDDVIGIYKSAIRILSSHIALNLSRTVGGRDPDRVVAGAFFIELLDIEKKYDVDKIIYPRRYINFQSVGTGNPVMHQADEKAIKNIASMMAKEPEKFIEMIKYDIVPKLEGKVNRLADSNKNFKLIKISAGRLINSLKGGKHSAGDPLRISTALQITCMNAVVDLFEKEERRPTLQEFEKRLDMLSGPTAMTMAVMERQIQEKIDQDILRELNSCIDKKDIVAFVKTTREHIAPILVDRIKLLFGGPPFSKDVNGIIDDVEASVEILSADPHEKTYKFSDIKNMAIHVFCSFKAVEKLKENRDDTIPSPDIFRAHRKIIREIVDKKINPDKSFGKGI